MRVEKQPTHARISRRLKAETKPRHAPFPCPLTKSASESTASEESAALCSAPPRKTPTFALSLAMTPSLSQVLFSLLYPILCPALSFSENLWFRFDWHIPNLLVCFHEKTTLHTNWSTTVSTESTVVPSKPLRMASLSMARRSWCSRAETLAKFHGQTTVFLSWFITCEHKSLNLQFDQMSSTSSRPRESSALARLLASTSTGRNLRRR